MSNLAVAPVPVVNVISFDEFKDAKGQGTEKPKRITNKVAGVSSEVYAFKTVEEISAMIKVFDKHIEEAANDDQRRIAWRNKMLFVVGINVGIRGSDLATLRWNFFYNEDGSKKKYYKIQPKKTRKLKKFVTLYFNDAVWSIIESYLALYPYENLNNYLFASRKGDDPITVDGIRKIIKNTAKEAGVNQNIGSHSLRKTFAFHVWHEAEDKEKALVILSYIMNHSSVATTRKYIGIMDEEAEDMFNGLNLGFDCL